MKEKPLRTKDLTQFKPGMFITTNGTGAIIWYLIEIKSPTVATVVTFDRTNVKITTVIDKDFSNSTAKYFTERSKKFFFNKLEEYSVYWRKR